jgi:hypothetical protein
MPRELPHDLEAVNYQIFPIEGGDLEDDAYVVLHATPKRRLDSILEFGFIPDCCKPEEERTSGLDGIYYEKHAKMSLFWVKSMQSNKESGEYCIIAVRYTKESFESNVKGVDGDLVDRTLDPQPTILDYCVVPQDFMFV